MQCVKKILNAHEPGTPINSFQFHEQLCILVSGGADNVIKFYDVQQKKSQVQAIEPKAKSGFFNFFSSFVSPNATGNEINGENVPKAFKCDMLGSIFPFFFWFFFFPFNTHSFFFQLA